METIIGKDCAVSACEQMASFHNALETLYRKHDIELSKNRGRRNVLMSGPMEHYLAEALRNTGLFDKVISDGRTGEPDIKVVLKGETTEIECKLTSPHQSSGSVVFQTDHDTLKNKGSLDYIYIVANADFDGFCTIYFKGLTIDDYRSLSPGARGKVAMYKHKGMKKANVLMGKVVSYNEKKIEKLVEEQKTKIEEKTLQLSKWRSEIEDSPNAPAKRKKLNAQILRGLEYIDSLVNNMAEEVRIIRNKSTDRYSLVYESIGDQK